VVSRQQLIDMADFKKISGHKFMDLWADHREHRAFSKKTLKPNKPRQDYHAEKKSLLQVQIAIEVCSKGEMCACWLCCRVILCRFFLFVTKTYQDSAPWFCLKLANFRG
jgi:hypothetical protein